MENCPVTSKWIIIFFEKSIYILIQISTYDIPVGKNELFISQRSSPTPFPPNVSRGGTYKLGRT
jgi:hypothetical protein